MKTIIAPTDFSDASLNAVNYAADLAVATGSNLMLVHITQVAIVYGDMPVDAITINDRVENAEERISNLAKQILERTNGKVSISTNVNPGGPLVVEIENYCKSVSTSFVVMGSQGSSAIERLFFGSNTISAMKKLSVPLIVVPPEATFKRLHNIGFACDLKKVAETAPVEEISTLVNLFNAKLHIIHINDEDDKKYPPEIIEESELLQEMFGELHPVYHFLDHESIAGGLSEYAEKNSLDLLIVIPKKHGFIDRLFHKSQAKQLMVHAHVPVLSMHE